VKPKVPKATKRGSYLIDERKMHDWKPGPKYEVVKPWFDLNKKKPVIRYGAKSTFIADFFKVPQERRVPGPGKYNLFKSDKEIE